MIKSPIDVSNAFRGNIEELRGRKDPEAMKRVAMEMESLFAYEMIKAMRQTVSTGADKALGNDTYMSMFDMELAKVLASRGLGLKEIFLKGLQRTEKSTENLAPPVNTRSGLEARPPTGLSVAAKPEVMPLPVTRKAQDTADLKVPPPETEVHPLYDEMSSLPVEGKISSPYGMRKHPIYGDHRFHNGLDIAAPAGTEIHPVRSGKVLFSGAQQGYGNVVIIDHGNGFITKYGHNELNLVREGDEVGTATIIGRVGSTGVSTGPHLHFEVRQNGVRIDPATVLAAR